MTRPFDIIPAIDLLDGEVVRLAQGLRERKTVYSSDPVEFAKSFEASGATRLHVVDLNGAFEGTFGNLEQVRAICGATSLRVELGGGIRTSDAARQAIEAGVQDVILGTRALEDGHFVRELAQLYPGRVIVGIDAKDGFVVTRGWTESSPVETLAFAKSIRELGVTRIIYTDVATDGMLSGPNLAALRRLAEAVPGLEVVASGGISRIEDLEAVHDLGLPNIVGAITGRAVYDGRIDLASAVQRLRARQGVRRS